MIEIFRQILHQPEYVHVLINPLPLYGLLMGMIGLVAAIALRSHSARRATLLIILVSSASAWPVFEMGEQAYDPVLSMSDEDGRAWLEAHKQRAEKFIYYFHALAALSVIALLVPFSWPKSSISLAVAVLLLGGVVVGMGGYIAYAGGKIRHREFRNEPAPKRVEQPEH